MKSSHLSKKVRERLKLSGPGHWPVVDRRVFTSATPFLEVLLISGVALLFHQYWKVDEHLVFFLVIVWAALQVSRRGIPVSLEGTVRLPLVALSFFALWLISSSMWAENVALSFAYSLLTVASLLAGVLLALSVSVRVVVLGFLLSAGVIAVHGLLQSGGLEGILNSHSGTGLFSNPVSLTFALGLAVSSVAGARLASQKYAWVWIVVAVALFFYMASRDILTSVLAVCAAAIVSAVIAHLRSLTANAQRWAIRAYVAGGTVVGALLFVFQDRVVTFLDGEPGFSGREPIWQGYVEAFTWSPILGTGWGTSVGWDPTPGELFAVKEFFPAHNGFLDIALMLGIVGLLLFAVAIFSIFFIGFKRSIDSAHSPTFAFIPVVLTYLVINDFMISFLPRFIGLFVIGVLLGFLLKKEVDDVSESVAVGGVRRS